MSLLNNLRQVLTSKQPQMDSADDLRQVVQKLRTEVDYLQLEVSRLRSLVRYLTPDVIRALPIQQQTKDSFDFQWGGTEDGNWTVTRPELKEREPKLVCQYTGLDRSWFKDKRVLDAGCGSGRFSYAMASMGAHVVAVDQSSAGVGHTRAACAEFPGAVEVHQHDLTKPLDFLSPNFDLVWSFGVLHHTGDTYGCFQNVSRLVKPGGYLFMMLYAEPAGEDPNEFSYYTEVERIRRLTCDMTLKERYEAIKELKGAEAGGWFDAVSPQINDTYPFHEIVLWLINNGFTDIRRPFRHPNHHVIARRQS